MEECSIDEEIAKAVHGGRSPQGGDARLNYGGDFTHTPANHATAQECYLDSIDYVFSGNPVFKEWARSWCKRSVVKNAIRLVFSERVHREGVDIWSASSASIAVDSVTRLPNLERFVFVMSVVLRYSDRECSVLLDCRMQGIVNTRSLALRRLGTLPR